MKKLLLLMLVMAGGLPAFGQAKSQVCPDVHLPSDPSHGAWIDRNNQPRTKEDLDGILMDHGRWLKEHNDFSTAEPTEEDLISELRADLRGARLTHADLNGASLHYANLDGADLRFANLTGADLRCASLSKTDLTGADLENADLQGSVLEGTILTKAELGGANLFYVKFEPKAIPAASGIARAKGLRTLWWDQKAWTSGPGAGWKRSSWNRLRAFLWAYPMAENGNSVEDLRKALHEAGYLGSEQEVNLAYHRMQERWLPTLLFDWTSDWGASWRRPLVFVFVIWLVCSFFYWGLISRWPERNSLLRFEKGAQPELTPIVKPSLWTSALFSLMSVLNLGVQGLNPGQWVRLLFRQDHDLQAQGWVRMFAGVQSLLGLGLLTLAAIAVLGHPIE